MKTILFYLDAIICNIKNFEFFEYVDSLELLNIVVGDPELFQSITDRVQAIQVLYVVAREHKYF